MDNLLKILIIIAVIMVILAVIALIRSNYELKNFIIKKYQIKAKVNEKCRFVLVSDLHNATFGEDNKRLLEAIDKLKPNFICIAGDMLVGSKEADNATAAGFVVNLARRYKVYYALGNHENRLKSHIEEYGDAYERYLELIDKYAEEIMSESQIDIKKNLVFLENISVDLPQYNIRISGLDIDQSYYNKIKRKGMKTEYLEYNLGLCDKSRYNILLAHHPRFFETYEDYGSDLVLAGHYHGGTVRFPGIGGFIATDFRMLPKYEKGMYVKNNTNMIVSGGLGTHTINVRLFNKPELVEIELEPEK